MKIVISVPNDTFEGGEHLARQLGISRSQLYSRAMKSYLGARGAELVTARLNAVYGVGPQGKIEPVLQQVQLKHFAAEAW